MGSKFYSLPPESVSPVFAENLKKWRESIPLYNPWYELIETRTDPDGQKIMVLKPVDIKNTEAVKGKHYKLTFEIV